MCGDIARHRWSEIVGFVQDAAERYYRSLWDLCSHEEKLVLVHLAEHGLVNPKRVELVRRLARRRLVDVDRRFRLMNESFREFVRTAEAPDRVDAWERVNPAETWSRVGVPLYALATLVVVILLYTEQSTVTFLVAAASGAAGTLGTLRNLYATTKGAAGVKSA